MFPGCGGCLGFNRSWPFGIQRSRIVDVHTSRVSGCVLSCSSLLTVGTRGMASVLFTVSQMLLACKV